MHLLSDKNTRFILLASTFVLLAWFVFFLVTLPFQSPDEPAHFGYVQSVYHWRYPSLPEAGVEYVPGMYDSEAIKGIRDAYYFNDIKANANYVFKVQPTSIESGKSDYTDVTLQANHPPLYYLLAAQIYRLARILKLSILGSYYMTKVASLIFYIIFLVSFWKSIKTRWSDQVAGYLTLAVALQPTLLLVSGSINPEMASIALFTLALYLLISGLETGPDRMSFAVLLAVISSAAFLSKFNAIIIIPIVVVAILRLSATAARKKLKFLLIYLGITSFSTLSWLVFNRSHFGNFLPSNVSLIYPNLAPITGKLSLASSVLQDFVKSIFFLPGNFGWLEAPNFIELRVLYMVIFLILLAIGIALIARRENGQTRCNDYPGYVSLLSLVTLMIFLLVYSWEQKASEYLVYSLQARYYLLGMAPAAVLFFSGVVRISPERRPESLAKLIFIVSYLFFLISLLYTLVPRFYV